MAQLAFTVMLAWCAISLIALPFVLASARGARGADEAALAQHERLLPTSRVVDLPPGEPLRGYAHP